MITKEFWDKIDPGTSPFLKFEFINALIQSGCIGGRSGWEPLLLTHHETGLVTFKKVHSYGEYIFDWAWADAYERCGRPYYPKLTSMIPYTPVTTPHFLIQNFNQDKALNLLKTHDDFFKDSQNSSAHFLFLEHREKDLFKENGYLLREGLQYHFFNTGLESFDDFLKTLKPKKAKTIKKERAFQKIEIRRFSGNDLDDTHASEMFSFYLKTIKEKGSYAYLNDDFFKLIFKTMKDNLLYVQASRNKRAVAGALFFFDSQKLYGRYWGCGEFIPHLHFELCYYQGIDFCIERGIKIFEAGAQGEHKISRGLRPTLIYSAHKVKDSSFHQAISNFIQKEKEFILRRKAELEAFLPFKTL